MTAITTNKKTELEKFIDLAFEMFNMNINLDMSDYTKMWDAYMSNHYLEFTDESAFEEAINSVANAKDRNKFAGVCKLFIRETLPF